MKIHAGAPMLAPLPATPAKGKTDVVAEAPPAPDSEFPAATMVAGTGGLAGAIMGGYAGSLGGALLGSALGGGAGLVLGALTHVSPVGWLSTSFATASEVGRVGIILGAGAGLVGGWKIGHRAVEKVAEKCGLSVAPRSPSSLSDSSPHGVAKFAAATVAGTGMAAGAVGGFLEAGALAGAGTVATGLLAGQVHWASVGANALVAGGVGALALGAAGAVGGWHLFRQGERVAKQAPKVLEWAKQAPQNGLAGGAVAGAALMVTTGLLGQLPFPLIGPAAAGVVGHGVGFGVGRLLTTPEHRDPLTFAHCMAIGGVVSMFSATSVLPLPLNLAARAAIGAVGGAYLGHKIRQMREGLQ